MPAITYFDRVWATTATTGTGAITVGAALTGFNAFSTIPTGSVFPYSLVEGANAEQGLGTMNADGTISRTIRKSTASGNAAITLAGNATIFVDPAAVDLPLLTSSTTQVFAGGLSMPGLTVSGNATLSGNLRSSNGAALTLQLADAGGVISMNAAVSALTIPANASVAFPIGTMIKVLQWCGAASTLVRASGVGLYWYPGSGTPTNGDRTIANGAALMLTKTAADTWAIDGQGIS